MKEPLTTDLGVSYQQGAQPFIQPNHIDGPMLCMRTGEVHWLTLFERIKFVFGWTDAYKLERKHSRYFR